MSPGLGHKVLLIGWDAADWQIINPLLDSGQMPNLEELVNRGCIGNIATLYPCLSPMLWTTVATGQTADRHGILGFVEPLPDLSGVQLSRSTSRKRRALWNIANLKGLRSIVVNWYASHPAEPINGICVSNEAFKAPASRDFNEWKLTPGSVHPEELSETIAGLRLHAGELSPNDIRPLIPMIDHVDHRKDARPSKLAEIVAKSVSVQSIFTAALTSQPWDFAAVFLDALDVAAHIFMPYYPPRMSNISEWDFALYQHVVPELYKFYDQMLGTVLKIVDPDTRILLVSDHGFESGSSRPTDSLLFRNWAELEPEGEAAEWHRPYGVLVMAGPGIKQDQRVYGATLLDVAPTVMEMLGLPKGSDMPGRVLAEAFWDGKGSGSIDSWEDVEGIDGQHSASAKFDPISAASEWEALAELGYLPKRQQGTLAETALLESEYNLAAVHLHHDRPQDALPILLSLTARVPDSPRYLRILAKCYHHLRQPKLSLEITQQLDQVGLSNLDTDLIAAKCLGAVGESQQANARFHEITQAHGKHSTAWCMWGEFLLDLSDGEGAWGKFQEAVRLSPDLYRAQLGKSKAALITGRPFEALNAAQEACKIHYFSPMAHFHRGLALERIGKTDEAIQAYSKAVEQQPNFYHAHQRLAELLQDSGNFAGAFNHSQEVHRLLHQSDTSANDLRVTPTALCTDWNELIEEVSAGESSSLHLFSALSSSDGLSHPDSEAVITIVSGLPRSGTSLLMQLIEACGIAPLMDATRLPDESNPRGYYEFEPVKTLDSDSSWLEGAVGKVVKVVYPNLLELPEGWNYRVFFLLRDLEEVLGSQSTMLARTGKSAVLSHTRLIARWRSSIPIELKNFQARTRSQVILVPFIDLFQDPDALGQQLNYWLGVQSPRNDLSGIADPSLHRQRGLRGQSNRQ